MSLALRLEGVAAPQGMAVAGEPLSLADIARADPVTIHDWMKAQQAKTKAATDAFAAAVSESGNEARSIAW
jgi:hypothetical protein